MPAYRRTQTRGDRATLGLLATACALLAATAAHAHVLPKPAFVEAGSATTILFETPNERRGHATTSLEITAPRGVELSSSTQPTPPGWEVELSPDRAQWSGGRIAGADVVSFPLTVTARTSPGPVRFAAVQGYDDGEVVRWTSALSVVPATAEEPPPQHFRRALVAGAVGLTVIAGSLVALRRLRRRPLQHR